MKFISNIKKVLKSKRKKRKCRCAMKNIIFFDVKDEEKENLTNFCQGKYQFKLFNVLYMNFEKITFEHMPLLLALIVITGSPFSRALFITSFE
jgi:hypothetical protein